MIYRIGEDSSSSLTMGTKGLPRVFWKSIQKTSVSESPCTAA